jgi:hypothetical protein
MRKWKERIDSLSLTFSYYIHHHTLFLPQAIVFYIFLCMLKLVLIIINIYCYFETYLPYSIAVHRNRELTKRSVCVDSDLGELNWISSSSLLSGSDSDSRFEIARTHCRSGFDELASSSFSSCLTVTGMYLSLSINVIHSFQYHHHHHHHHHHNSWLELQGTRTLSSVSVSGFTRLCKGLSLILVAAHLLLNFFPPAINYLALIPARYLFTPSFSPSNFNSNV